MKTGNNELQIEMTKEDIERITREVKETLAFGYTGKNKTFSSAELWSIQRRRKNILSRRYYAS